MKEYLDNLNYVINTFGCQMNVHESEKIAGILTKLGYTEGKDQSAADILVFNTCCIRETAEQKIYGHLGIAKRFKKANPNLIVVLCGCMTQQSGAEQKIREKFPFVDIILGTSNLHLLEDAVKLARSKRAKLFNTEFDCAIDESLALSRTSFPNAWVNITYGCNNFCTYCIVPYVRGRERSRTMESVLNEVNDLVESGFREITLLGQNVNSFGNDLSDGTNFATLLNEIGKIEGKFRLRFLTSHPKDLTDDVIDAVSNNPNICRHIHLPVQSGSTKVLKAMNRKYTREQYLQLIDKIRAKIPDVGITTDIMIGFPEETQKDFLDTLYLVSEVEFLNAFCFVYSPRNGTPASLMPQLDSATKKQRITTLLSLQNKIVKEQSKKMHGQTFEVLFDDKNSKFEDTYCGRTEFGRLVNVKSQTDLIGKFAKVKIVSSSSATLWGELV